MPAAVMAAPVAASPAEGIAEWASDAAEPSRRSAKQPTICENCDGKIGRLETPKVYEGHMLCDACFEKLAKSKAVITTPQVAENAAGRDQIADGVALGIGKFLLIAFLVLFIVAMFLVALTKISGGS